MLKAQRSRLNAPIDKRVKQAKLGRRAPTITMRNFDLSCLTPIQEMMPEKIVALRAREQLSQILLADYLNVTPNLVKKWEAGKSRPHGSALKLLTLIYTKGLETIS